MGFDSKLNGVEMYKWASDLFPICRSITGNGVRETLSYMKNILPDLNIKKIDSGTKVYDWSIPDEWNIYDAYIEDENGFKWVDFNKNNLHVVGYSESIDLWMGFDELDQYLHTLPSQPNAIPYITSYYNKTWGFCLSENDKKEMPNGKYHVVINSTTTKGVMNYADIVIEGKSNKEVILSTYICHPSMANNELSGPVVAMKIVNWLLEKKRKHTYRIIFIPETIGSIAYIYNNRRHLQEHVIAGYVLTCIGDNRQYSFMPSRQYNSLSDRVARSVYRERAPDFTEYSYLERGSDERQYCSPGIDLPIASIMRSKYREYPEYHTSLDDLSVISPEGLYGGYNIVKECIRTIEGNEKYVTSYPCEPQLGKHGIMSTLSNWVDRDNIKDVLNIIAYADGNNDILTLAEKAGVEISECLGLCDMLYKKGVLSMGSEK
jgi:aminopeptidase-like protein